MLSLPRWIPPWAKSFTVRHEGRAFSFPRSATPDLILRRMARSGRFYEHDLLEALQGRIPAGRGCAVDCGANVGNHSVFFAGVLGLSVFAFEPIARNRELLLNSVALNRLDFRVHVVPLALGDQEELVQLACADAGNPGTYAIADGDALAAPGAVSETTRVVRLDEWLAREGRELLQNEGPLRLLKVDVEGFEPRVLRGAREALTREGPIVCCECVSRESYAKLLGELKPLGYVATGVYCVTPTVVFERAAGARQRGTAGVVDTSAAVEARLLEFERKGYG